MDLLKYLHPLYRKDLYIKNLAKGFCAIYDKIDIVLLRLSNLLHFNRLDENGCQFWERLIAIKNIYTSLDDRRALIRAKWMSVIHNDIELIRKICNLWKNGETIVDFVAGKIQIKFCSIFGVPENLKILTDQIDEVKPAHLAYEILYKYLLIQDIHQVKTIEELQNCTLDMFARGAK